MKALIVLAALLSTSACEAIPIGGIGAATALSLEANYPKVDKKAEEIFKAE